MTRLTDLCRDLPQPSGDESFETLVETPGVRIERIVSNGHASPEGFWHDSPRHEWVAVLRGAALLRFEDETIEMTPGRYVNIAAHRKHRVDWTTPNEPTIWLAVHYGDPG